jgi:hypothetical protein
MQFLFPAFLFALAALAIPIIIHLFHFRRFKKVYFTNVRFLREVKEETSARSRLRNLLVLLMRLLAVAFLVFAFAQPFIPADDKEVKSGSKAVSIFVDNSFSMQALSQDVPLLEKAKQRAREIVQAYPPGDEFQIITNDFEGRHQRLLGRDDALAMIDEIEASPAVRQLSEVLARQRQVLSSSESENEWVYQISDFQQNITDIENLSDTTYALNLVPLQAVQEKNISIDSAWFVNPVPMPNQPNPLIVKVRNLTDETAENIRLSIRHDGQTKPVGTLSVPAGAALEDTVNISIQRTGWHEAQLSITDYPIQFDDNYYFAFNVKEQIRALSINESQPNRYLSAAFSGVSNFELTNLQSQGLDYSQFTNYDLIVVNELRQLSSGLAFELSEYAKNGGNLLVFPNRNANLESYNDFLGQIPANELQTFEEQAREVGRVNTDEFVFNDVFENRSANLKLPNTQGNFRLSGFSTRGEEPLLTYRDGTTMLAKYQAGEGHLYLSAAPLSEEYNQLVRNGEIFVPMVFKMAISSRRGQRIAHTIGQDATLMAPYESRGTELVYKLQGEGGEFIPEQRIIGTKAYLNVNEQVKEAGFYDLFFEGEDPIATYAFNYDRRESVLDYYGPDALAEYVGPVPSIISVTDEAVLTAEIEERSQGTALWRWCLILALVFLGVEVVLLRFWKV